MTPETLALITAYFVCSATAEERVMTRTEVETCSVLYMDTKLAFLPDVDATLYAAMSANQRAEVNRRGYAAFVGWKTANPNIVTELEAKARASNLGQVS